MTSTEAPITIRMSKHLWWLLGIGGGVLGVVVGFLVKPVVRWAVDTVGDAPGPLRLAATLPTTWAVVVLTVLGVAGGIVLAAMAWDDSPVLTVGPTSVQLLHKGADRYVPRESIARVFLDGKSLVMHDRETKVLARVHDASDLNLNEVRAAFERFGYPWGGSGDPHEQEFRRWMDGQPGLDEGTQDLLRARARALADKKRGSVAELTDQLQEHGIVVRDRSEAQEYRVIPNR